MEPPRERFERSISEQEERVKELLDNFKAEMLRKFQEQDRRIAAQQKTIEEQNETIQMIATHPDIRDLLQMFKTGAISPKILGKLLSF